MHTYCESVFRQSLLKISTIFAKTQGCGRQHCACLDCSRGGSSHCTPYQTGVEYGPYIWVYAVESVQQNIRKRLHTFFLYPPVLELPEENTFYVFHLLLVVFSAALMIVCSPEERKDLVNQIIQNDSQQSEGDNPGSGDEGDQPTTPTGTYALDDGTGLTTRYLSFNNGNFYDFRLKEGLEAVVNAQGYLWHCSFADFESVNPGDFSIQDGQLICAGVPYGAITVKIGEITLEGEKFTKFGSFKSTWYTTLTVTGYEEIYSYSQQIIEWTVSLDKTVPASIPVATSENDWLSDFTVTDGKLSFLLSENNTGKAREGQVTVRCPGAENKIIAITQSYSDSEIVLPKSSQQTDHTGGTFSFEFSINNPREGVTLTAESQNDWITDVLIDDNTISYKVAENISISRKGFIRLSYGEHAVAGFAITQERSPNVTVVNLSASGTSNCYIVSSANAYFFRAVKGNTNISVGVVYSADVLWESFGTATAPVVEDVIRRVKYESGYVFFETFVPLSNGNAVIAAKDAKGNILWSWHIWVCKDFDPVTTARKYYGNDDKMMDRNLGATSATPGDVGALGLLYQWGRKDPFLSGGSIWYSSFGNQTKAASTLSWPSPVTSDSSNGTIDYAVKNPTTFIKGVEGTNYDWVYSNRDNTLWKSGKTIYDPCPPGWRVPDGGGNGVWAKAANGSSTFGCGWNSTKKGVNFSGKFVYTGTIWYPAAGYFVIDGTLYCVGEYGYWWSCTPSDDYACSFSINYQGYAHPSDKDRRAKGFSVRCIQE